MYHAYSSYYIIMHGIGDIWNREETPRRQVDSKKFSLESRPSSPNFISQPWKSGRGRPGFEASKNYSSQLILQMTWQYSSIAFWKLGSASMRWESQDHYPGTVGGQRCECSLSTVGRGEWFRRISRFDTHFNVPATARWPQEGVSPTQYKWRQWLYLR